MASVESAFTHKLRSTEMERSVTVPDRSSCARTVQSNNSIRNMLFGEMSFAKLT